MDRDGGHSRVLTPQLDRDVQNPRWAPDGKGIYFVYDDQGDTKLAYSTLDGSVRPIAAHLGSVRRSPPTNTTLRSRACCKSRSTSRR